MVPVQMAGLVPGQFPGLLLLLLISNWRDASSWKRSALAVRWRVWGQHFFE